MNRTILFLIAFVSFSLFGSVSVLAGSVFVSEAVFGDIIKVAELGNKTIYASNLGRPGLLKFDRNKNLFVLDFGFPEGIGSPRILKITPTGSISIFTTGIPTGLRSLNDLTVSDDNSVFLLDNNCPLELPACFTEIWELFENGPSRLLTTIQNAIPFGQTARGFTFGPGGYLYLAMQGGQGTARILQVTRAGDVSTFFDSGIPSVSVNPNGGGADFIDVRFNSQGDMLILANVLGTIGAGIPTNPRAIFKVHDEVLSTLVGPTQLRGDGLQLTIDANDNLFVCGGGFGGDNGFIQRVDPSGNITTLATFPPRDFIDDIDDDSFDSFSLLVPINIKSNQINPRSNKQIQVTILTTNTFDATTLDPTTVQFGVVKIKAVPVRYELKDINKDGHTDLILYFKIGDTDIQCGDTSASLTGDTFSGQAIVGSDSITTLGCK